MKLSAGSMCIVMVLVLAAMVAQAAERVFPLDLVKQHEADEKLQIKAVGPQEYEWSLPDGIGQKLDIDLKKLGVDPHDYDELRFDLKPLGSQVGLHAALFGMPGPNDVSSWYTKFRTGTGEWAFGRFELRVDDDGAFLYPENVQTGLLRFDLSPRLLGFPGEPKWRKAILRNPCLIKWAVATDFEPRDVMIVTDDKEIAYTFPLRLTNRMDKPVTAIIEIDPEKGLKSFATEPSGKTSVELAAGAEKIVPIRIFMTAAVAKALAPGYGERICPKVSVEGLADSETQPLLGYRNMYMWAVVPARCEPWTPAKLQARVAEAAGVGSVDGWRKGIVAQADEALKYDFPAYDWWSKPGTKPGRVPHWGNSYRCPECKDGQLRQVTPNDLDHHVCPRCKKTFENDPHLEQCARQEYASHRFADIRNLAMAWLLTGEAKYADKSITMMLAYAEAHPTMSIADHRSTAGGSRLAQRTLATTWFLPHFAEGYALLAAYPGLDSAKRKRIDEFLMDEGLRVQRHGCEFNNQQAEHIRTYGTVAMATGYWPLLGEALHGDFGWNPMVEFAYSGDGVNHEGRAYHCAQFQAMNTFARFAAARGVDLMTPRFKRVFDASVTLGLANSTSYELAYRQYRDPTYLVALEAERKYGLGEWAVLSGVLDLPKAAEVKIASKLMDGMGYIFLRRGTAADYREIRLNYKEQFDRHEQDRFGTTFYRNGSQVDGGIGRCNYADPGAHFMCSTPAHNTIVIDGRDSREVISDLLVWQGDGDTPLAVVATDPKATLYEGVRQLRGIALIGDAYVVLDRVVCDKPRTIDRYQYGEGKGTFAFPLQATATPPVKLPEAGRFTDVVTGAAGKEARLGFENSLNMRLVCDQDMVAGKALTPVGGWRPATIEVTWARVDNAKEATFLAVFALGKDIEPPAARIVKSADDEIAIALKDKDKTWTLTIKPKEKKAGVEMK